MSERCRWLIITMLFAAAGSSAQEDCKGLGGELARTGFVPNRILVRPLNKNLFLELVDSNVRSFTSAPIVVREVAATGTFSVDSRVATTAQLLDAFGRKKDLFDYIERDVAFGAHASVEPNEEEFTLAPETMWGLRQIHAPEAWEYGQGSKTVVAAVLDSGLQRLHEDLVDNVFSVPTIGLEVPVSGVAVRCNALDFGYDSILGNCLPHERNRHGTRVSGVIGARGNNNKYVVGVNWEVTLMAVAFLDENNVGCASRAAKALEFVRRAKEAGTNVRVVNLSWGGHQHSRLIEDELVKLADAGIVIVVSAGNEGESIDSCPMFPASYTNISTLIVVAATEIGGGLWGHSNRSNTSVHIAAPGAMIRTTDPTYLVADGTGTSMAAPFVSGAVALIASQCPALSALDLKDIILRNADTRPKLGAQIVDGRFLNVEKAAKACDDLKKPPSAPAALH